MLRLRYSFRYGVCEGELDYIGDDEGYDTGKEYGAEGAFPAIDEGIPKSACGIDSYEGYGGGCQLDFR